MSKKPWYAIALAEDGRSATIAVRGTIGDRWEGSSIERIDYDLANIGAVDEITVRITSFGGKLEHGLAMHNALKRHPARVVAIVEGVAASAGSIVAMAGDEIRMYANSTMMIHGVTLLDEEGNVIEDDDAARALNASLIETYRAKTGKTDDELAALISHDTWMTAREAVSAGFADSVIEISAAAPAQPVSMLAAFASAMQIPVDVLERAQAEAAEPATSEGGNPSAALAGAEASATFAAQINTIAVAHGLGDYVAAWLLDGGIATVEQARAAITEACEVRDLCAYANASDRAPGFIQTRKSLAEVRAELINARADAADQLHTDGHPLSGGQRAASPGARAVTELGDVYARNRSNARKAFPRMF